MVSGLDYEKPRVVLELGPGNGVISRELLTRLSPGSRLILIEISEKFCQEFLQFSDERVSLIQGSALDLKQYLRELEIETVDYIISSLPLTNFPKKDKESLLRQAHDVLSAEGTFMQYQYSTTALKMLKRHFNQVKLSFITWNFPPAVVYSCLKKMHD